MYTLNLNKPMEKIMKLNQLFLAALLLIASSVIYADDTSNDSNLTPDDNPDVPAAWYES